MDRVDDHRLAAKMQITIYQPFQTLRQKTSELEKLNLKI